MKSFIYNSFSSRVVFGEGSSLKLNQYLHELNCKKAIIISGQTQAARAKSIFNYLDNNCVDFYNNATMHSPIEITEEALKLTSKNNSGNIPSHVRHKMCLEIPKSWKSKFSKNVGRCVLCNLGSAL